VPPSPASSEPLSPEAAKKDCPCAAPVAKLLSSEVMFELEVADSAEPQLIDTTGTSAPTSAAYRSTSPAAVFGASYTLMVAPGAIAWTTSMSSSTSSWPEVSVVPPSILTTLGLGPLRPNCLSYAVMSDAVYAENSTRATVTPLPVYPALFSEARS
jgi:hypothetical protein